MRRWAGHTFAALENRHFRVLWLGTLLSFVGFFMSTVVQSVVAFRLTGENTSVGLVVFGQGLTMFVLGPIGGAFADRWSKRRVIATCQVGTTLVFVALGSLVALDLVTVLWLTFASMVMGAAFSFIGPARQAFVIELVPEAHRGNAVALSQVANSASRVLGPAFAGVLLAWSVSGAAGAYLVMGCLYGLAAMTIGLLPRSPARANAKDTHPLSDVVDGVRYVFGNPRLRVLMGMAVLPVIVGFPYVTVLPGLVENEFGLPAEAIGMLYGISAVGGLATGVAVARHADSPRAPSILSALGFAFGLCLLALAFVPTYATAVVMMFVLGAANGGFQTLSSAVVIRESDPVYVGRVMSLTMLAFAGFGLAGLPIGYLADVYGERATLFGMGGAVCAIVAGLFAVLTANRKAAEQASRG